MGKDMKFPDQTEAQVPGICDVMQYLSREMLLLDFSRASKIVVRPLPLPPKCHYVFLSASSYEKMLRAEQLWFFYKVLRHLIPPPPSLQI